MNDLSIDLINLCYNCINMSGERLSRRDFITISGTALGSIFANVGLAYNVIYDMINQFNQNHVIQLVAQPPLNFSIPVPQISEPECNAQKNRGAGAFLGGITLALISAASYFRSQSAIQINNPSLSPKDKLTKSIIKPSQPKYAGSHRWM